MHVIFLVLFGLFVDYDSSASPKRIREEGSAENGENQSREENVLSYYYPMFQDIHVMIFVGFGFLMAFLKLHGYGSVGFNFLLGCFLIEWATLVNGWFTLIDSEDSKIFIGILEFIKADFALAAVMISFGAVLGKISPVQMLVMAIFEIVFYNLSLWIGESILEVSDVGGSIYIHAFGAYFGLAITRVLYKTHHTTSSKEDTEYHSNIFAMVGTIFLWVFWPSFNAGLLTDDNRHRAVINTILSLAACTVVTFAVSAITSKKNKLDMAHIQNATLAGGVAVGASANLMIHPFGAMLAGTVAGIISVVGFKYIQPALQRVFKIHDTCGVHNLHGMPGILGALISAIVCCVASPEVYQDSFKEIFHTRSPAEQGGFQVAGLVATLAIALASGTLTGFLMKLPIWDQLLQEELFDDEAFWEMPSLNEYESLAPSDDKEFPHLESEEAGSSYSDKKAISKESLQQQTE